MMNLPSVFIHLYKRPEVGGNQNLDSRGDYGKNLIKKAKSLLPVCKEMHI